MDAWEQYGRAFCQDWTVDSPTLLLTFLFLFAIHYELFSITWKMKNNHKRKANENKRPENLADHTSPDNDADKTGTDINSDSTEIRKVANKFDKPKRETDPDSTGIDINSDKTKKEKTSK